MAHNLSNRNCNYCGKFYKPTSARQKVCPDCKILLRSDSVSKCAKEAQSRAKLERNKFYAKKWFTYLSSERRILRNIKSRAFKLNIDFDLTINDIIIPEYCPVLGVKLEQGKETLQFNSPSVDRIDPVKGYVKGNVQIISMRANTMKNNASVDQLQRFAAWINKTYPHS